jgi:hypothetical protein
LLSSANINPSPVHPAAAITEGSLAMISTVTFYDFCGAFRDMDRDDNFSYQGKRALFDFFEQWEEETGQPVELDVIAICCEWNESTWEEIADDYQLDVDGLDDDELADRVREYLEENTLIAGDVVGGCVFQAF